MTEQHHAVFDQGVHKDILHLGVGCAGEAAEEAGEQTAKKAETSCNTQSPPEGLLDVFLVIFFLDNSIQGKDSQHRQRNLQHHQRHGHRAELVIERQILETERRKRHEMAPHGHEYRYYAGRYNPPFFPLPVKAKTQHKEEDGYSAHIHWPCRKRLRSPVQRKALCGLLEIPLAGTLEELYGFRFVRIHGPGRGAAIEVRNHEVGKLFPAIAPRRGVVQVKAFGVVATAGKLRAASHCVRGVLCQRKQLVHIGCYTRPANKQKQEACLDEALPVLVPDGGNKLHKGIQQHHYGKIVSNLLMICLNLHAQGKSKEDGAKEHTRPFPGKYSGESLSTAIIRKYQRSKHPWHEGYSLHLGVVAHLDNLEIVAAEGNGHGPAKGQRPAYTKRQKQQKCTQKCHKQVCGRTLAGKKQIVQHLCVVSAVLGGDGRCGHAAKHGVCPVSGIVRMLFVPGVHLMGHTHIAGDVALVHYLSLKYLRHKAIAEGKQQRHHSNAYCNLFPNFLHSDMLSSSRASSAVRFSRVYFSMFPSVARGSFSRKRRMPASSSQAKVSPA